MQNNYFIQCSCCCDSFFKDVFVLKPHLKLLNTLQAFNFERVTEKQFSYFSTKTYVVGTEKNRLNETVLLSTQNIY